MLFLRVLLLFFLSISTVFTVIASDFEFIENKGQWPKQVKFMAYIPSGELYFENNRLLFHLYDQDLISDIHIGKRSFNENTLLKHHAFAIEFANVSNAMYLQSKKQCKQYYNYFKGNDKSKWASNILAFKELTYKNIYDGIDLVFYTHNAQLKYDFVVHPGANPASINLLFKGLDKINLKNNNIYLKTSLGSVIKETPITYQWNNDAIAEVNCNYVLQKNNLSFAIANYDKTKELIIDPVLIFSTFSGSFSNNFGYTATFDAAGNLYSGSTAFGNLYPTTVGAYSTTFKGSDVDVAISKYDTSGTTRIYATFLGGTLNELPHSLIVNNNDELLVMGTTSSSDFPTSIDAFQKTFQGGTNINLAGLGVVYPFGCDIFVSKLSSDGASLLASTFLGGSGNDGLNTAPSLKYNYADEVRGEVEIDENDNVYIASCTFSTNYPVSNAFQANNAGQSDGVITKLSPNLNQLIFSTYLGGESNDAIYSLSFQKNGNIVVAGGTESIGFPNNALNYFMGYMGGRADGFVSVISPIGNSLLLSSYFGVNSYDQIYFVEVDKDDRIYIFGQTEALGNPFVINAQYSVVSGGQFITKISHDLDTILWSTSFGVSPPAGSLVARPNLSPTAFMVDLCNAVYLSGWGGNTNIANAFNGLNNNAASTNGLPVTPDALQSTTDGSDFYLMVMEDDASALIYASYIGGNLSDEHVDGGTSRFDRKGKIYQSVCAGCGFNSDFPTTPNAVSATNNSSCNAAVFKMDFLLPMIVADFNTPSPVCAPYSLQVNNYSKEQSATEFLWLFSDGDSSTTKNPNKTFTIPGTYEITLIISDTGSCNRFDTISRTIVVAKDTSYNLPNLVACKGQQKQIGVNSESGKTYQWFPPNFLSNPSVSNPNALLVNDMQYQLFIQVGACTDTAFLSITVDSITVELGNDTIICSTQGPIFINPSIDKNGKIYQWSSNSNFTDTLNANLNDSSLVLQPMQALNRYYFRAINDSGCIGFDSILVTISDFAMAKSGDTVICIGDTLLLSAFSLNPLNPLTYLWEPANEIIGSNTQADARVAPLQDETYFITTNDAQGCNKRDSINVKVSLLKGLPISVISDKDTIYRGTSAQFTAKPELYKYSWEPPLGLSNASIYNPTASPATTTEYTVRISDAIQEDCYVEQKIHLVVLEVRCEEPYIFIPNAFSPNGDNENDILLVRSNVLKEIDLAVYNRWGEMVFETNELTKGWDGMYNNRLAEPGVFVYHLRAICIDNQQFIKKGNVTLLR